VNPANASEESSGAAPARVAAILAGGISGRMGSPKAGIDLAGRPLIAHVIAAAREAGLSPIVVAKRGSQLPPLDCPLIAEPAELTHPLVGIIAALEHCDAPIVALACDMPMLPPALIGLLANIPTPFAMPIHPQPQPLAARYTPATLERLRAALEHREPLVAAALALDGTLLHSDELTRFGDPGWMFANANDRKELERISAELLRRPEGAPRPALPGA
jgi:molybdopterin-guanine dinucleotide biosynthesis protein A